MAVVGILAMIYFGLRLSVAFTVILLASAKGEPIKFSDAYAKSSQYWLKFLGATLLTSLAILGGTILFIIPGLILGAWFSLAPYIVISENLGVIDSMKRSRELVKGHTVEMLGLTFFEQLFGVLNFIPILGAIAVVLIQIIFWPTPQYQGSATGQ